jgi:Skp family chaperone for outer membrane proteins
MKNIAIALSLTTLLATAAGAASADEYSGYTGFVSTKTRAEVQAETREAIKLGEIRSGEQYPDTSVEQHFVQPKTRAQVKAELAAYRQAHPGSATESADLLG